MAARIPEPYAGKLATYESTAYGHETRRKLDALSAAELLARLIEVDRCHGLMKSAPPDLARGYAARSTAILRAMPRQELADRVAALEKTASAAAPEHARQCHAAAAQLARDNPQPSDGSVNEAKRLMREQTLADLARAEARVKAARTRSGGSAAGKRPTQAQITAAVGRAVRAAVAPHQSRIKALEADLARTKARRADAEAAAAKQAAQTPTMLYKGSGGRGE